MFVLTVSVGAAERGVGDVKTFQELSKSVNNSIAGKTVLGCHRCLRACIYIRHGRTALSTTPKDWG